MHPQDDDGGCFPEIKTLFMFGARNVPVFVKNGFPDILPSCPDYKTLLHIRCLNLFSHWHSDEGVHPCTKKQKMRWLKAGKNTYPICTLLYFILLPLTTLSSSCHSFSLLSILFFFPVFSLREKRSNWIKNTLSSKLSFYRFLNQKLNSWTVKIKIIFCLLLKNINLIQHLFEINPKFYCSIYLRIFRSAQFII